MYERTNRSTGELRERAAQVRAGNAAFAPTTRTAPIEKGERLAAASRGESEELRFTWTEYNGRPFLSIRLWARDVNGQSWPQKDKGIAIRRHELTDLATAATAALDHHESIERGGR